MSKKLEWPKRYWLNDMIFALAASSVAVIWNDSITKTFITEGETVGATLATMSAIFITGLGIAMLFLPVLFHHLPEKMGSVKTHIYLADTLKVLKYAFLVCFWAWLFYFGAIVKSETLSWPHVPKGFTAWCIYYFMMWQLFVVFRIIHGLKDFIDGAMVEILTKKIQCRIEKEEGE